MSDQNLPSGIVPFLTLASGPSPYLWLLAITSPTDGPLYDLDGEQRVVRVARSAVPVAFGTDATGVPLRWRPWPIEFSSLTSRSDGSIDGARVTISNVGGVAQRLHDLNDHLANHTVRITIVHADTLNDPNSGVTFRLRVSQSRVAGIEALQLTLSSHNLRGVTVPSDLITRQCRWRYRGPECGFVGDPENTLGQCAKTLAACKVRGVWELENSQSVEHPRRFGGFPALPVGSVPLT